MELSQQHMNLWSFPSNILTLAHGAFPPNLWNSDNVDSNMELSLQHMTSWLSLQHGAFPSAFSFLNVKLSLSPWKPDLWQPPDAEELRNPLTRRQIFLRKKTWRRKKGESDGAHKRKARIYNLRNKFTHLVEDIPKLWLLLVLCAFSSFIKLVDPIAS